MNEIIQILMDSGSTRTLGYAYTQNRLKKWVEGN